MTMTPGVITDEIMDYYYDYLDTNLSDVVGIGQIPNLDSHAKSCIIEGEINIEDKPTRNHERYDVIMTFTVRVRGTNIREYRQYMDQIIRLLRRREFNTTFYQCIATSGAKVTRDVWTSTYKRLTITVPLICRALEGD